MPCLSGRFVPNIGPLINVGVIPTGVTPSSGSARSTISTFPALLDTGATMTCISQSVAQSANLRPIGMRSMVSATQSLPVNVYLVDLLLPFGPAGLIIQGAQVMEFSAAGVSPFQVLVGRDIICQGTLTISFDAHFTFCL